MADDEKRKLEMAVAALQGKWGVRAIRRGATLAQEVPHIPTGFPGLDGLLGAGGVPRGRLTEIIGVPTSGMATLALKIVANAQEGKGDRGRTTVYVDLEGTFDPDYAARCGVVLEQLVLVRPEGVRQGLAVVRDLVLDGGLDVIILDVPFPALRQPATAGTLATTLVRLLAPLAKSECALICLTPLPPGSTAALDAYPPAVTLPHYASVRLFLERERWLHRGQDIRGYQAQVQVVKDKLSGRKPAAPAGTQQRTVPIAITFNGVVQGEGTAEDRR